jgi:hypothetical protein
MNDWQTWTALAVVICTATIMLWRILRKRKQLGCDSDCDSSES